MSLYQDWIDYTQNITQEEANHFQADYYAQEMEIYKKILDDPQTVLQGKFAELSEQFALNDIWMMAFIDGINDSLKKPYDLEKIKTSSAIKLDVDLEKLYYNMLEAKADWLYNLPQWDNLLTEQRRKEIAKERRLAKQAHSEKIDRNAPCPCGSGKKYKKCCGANR